MDDTANTMLKTTRYFNAIIFLWCSASLWCSVCQTQLTVHTATANLRTLAQLKHTVPSRNLLQMHQKLPHFYTLTSPRSEIVRLRRPLAMRASFTADWLRGSCGPLASHTSPPAEMIAALHAIRTNNELEGQCS